MSDQEVLRCVCVRACVHVCVRVCVCGIVTLVSEYVYIDKSHYILHFNGISVCTNHVIFMPVASFSDTRSE